MNCPWCSMPRLAVSVHSRLKSPKGYTCDDCGITWEPDGIMTYRVTRKTPHGDNWTWKQVPEGALMIRAEEAV